MSRLKSPLVALLLLTCPAIGQPEKRFYQMHSPKGWGKETIALPPSFAPDMNWKGVAELHFAPGMFKADSDSFLSYVLLFWISADQKIDRNSLELEFLTHYRGLAKALERGKEQEVDVGTFIATIKDAPVSTGKRPSGKPFSA